MQKTPPCEKKRELSTDVDPLVVVVTTMMVVVPMFSLEQVHLPLVCGLLSSNQEWVKSSSGKNSFVCLRGCCWKR